MAKKISQKTEVTGTTGTLNAESNFSVVEAYKAVRTNLLFALHSHKKCKKVLFTSALPGEGKTTTSVNTAITIAQTATKVLIIDCDLRKPRIHQKFGLRNEVGLSNVLSGMANLEDAIHPTGKDNLWAITSGVLPPNPAELLGSDAMKEILSRLEQEFDYIIIDTPPVNIVADTLSLTKLVDGVVLVVRYKSSTHPSMKDALSKLEFVDANVIGTIMNSVSTPVTKKYYKGTYSKYGYKYARYETYGYGNNSAQENLK